MYELHTEIYIHPLDLNKDIVFFPRQIYFRPLFGENRIGEQTCCFFSRTEKKTAFEIESVSKFKPFPEKTNKQFLGKKYSDNYKKIKVVQIFETECVVDLKNFTLHDIFNNFGLLVFLNLGAAQYKLCRETKNTIFG